MQGTGAAKVRKFSRQPGLVSLMPVHRPVVIATNSVNMRKVRQCRLSDGAASACCGQRPGGEQERKGRGRCDDSCLRNSCKACTQHAMQVERNGGCTHVKSLSLSVQPRPLRLRVRLFCPLLARVAFPETASLLLLGRRLRGPRQRRRPRPSNPRFSDQVPPLVVPIPCSAPIRGFHHVSCGADLREPDVPSQPAEPVYSLSTASRAPRVLHALHALPGPCDPKRAGVALLSHLAIRSISHHADCTRRAL